jgi:CMP/dCMP kinase
VLDGRDIGTVVFPDADVKVFMVADAGERARRRHAELAARGEAADVHALEAEIVARDAQDAARAVGPLRPAADAVHLDTTRLSPDEQVAFVVRLAAQRRKS